MNRDRTLAGTGTLLRLLLRRDRVRLVVWVASLSAIIAAAAASILNLYDTPEALQNYATLARDNTAVIVQGGPGHGLDDPTTGAVLMNESGIWTLVAVSLMSVFLVTRHTRHEEETGRAELVRAAPVGRHAAAASTMLGALIANAAVAIAIVGVLVVSGLPAIGAAAFGAALVGTGMTFAGLALVSAQIAASARAATGLGVALIGLSFVIRAIGDVGDGRLSWVSPIGWGQAIRAFADERWWVLAIPMVATALLVVAADALTSRRDLGRGLVPERPGPADAPDGLSGVFGLALRLQRASIVAWVCGLSVLGAFMGVVANDADNFLADTPELADFFARFGEGSLVDAFLATTILLLALAGSGYTVSAVLRLRGEETDGRVDSLLSAPLARRRWMTSHLALAAAGTGLIMVVAGFATGVGHAVAAGDTSRVLPPLGAAVAAVPAMLVLGGVAAALFGILPRWTLMAWAVFALALAIGLLGDLLRLPQQVTMVSPFVHVPDLPGGTVEALPLMALIAVTAALTILGLTGIRRRDLA